MQAFAFTFVCPYADVSIPVFDPTMFFCAISGEPPQDPVVSMKSGHVYERRLILKYIAENGTDPMTGEKLEENDLVTVKASKRVQFHLSCVLALDDEFYPIIN
jgi:SUMO ligase MMS21 Smc5/6 complex component